MAQCNRYERKKQNTDRCQQHRKADIFRQDLKPGSKMAYSQKPSQGMIRTHKRACAHDAEKHDEQEHHCDQIEALNGKLRGGFYIFDPVDPVPVQDILKGHKQQIRLCICDHVRV